MYDAEAFDADPDPRVFVAEGTVGFPGDPDVTQLGLDHEDGITLIKVTLKQPAPEGAPMAEDGGFNGVQIACRLGGLIWDVPGKGTRVIVVFPDGDMSAPGNGVILTQIAASPSKRFGRKKSILDFGDKDLVIVARSVTLISEDEGRHMVSVSGQGGCQAVSDGSGFFCKHGEISVKTVDEAGNLKAMLILNQVDATLGIPSPLSIIALTAQGPELQGQYITCEFATGMKLGALASPATPVLLGLSGPAGVPSTCIWGTVTP